MYNKDINSCTMKYRSNGNDFLTHFAGNLLSYIKPESAIAGITDV